MLDNAEWIGTGARALEACPVFRRTWHREHAVVKASLQLSAVGVYTATLNGQAIGANVLAPGWTEYQARLQVQTHDVTATVAADNELLITVGPGWARSNMPGWVDSAAKVARMAQPAAVIAVLTIDYQNGDQEQLVTDDHWQWALGPVCFSDIYDGEVFDATKVLGDWQAVQQLVYPKNQLIPQAGPLTYAQRYVMPRRVIQTPAGETVIDFGQEVTGYVQFSVDAAAGDTIAFDHGEMLDAAGNFYNENYRGAKAEVRYRCRDGQQTWHPQLTFFGFRYIRIKQWPGAVNQAQLTAVSVYSQMRQTGTIKTSNEKLNRLFRNVEWGQVDNFLDVPTDCPQRDERLGWTGDVLAFVKTATYNFDVSAFFTKWLQDVAVAQKANGAIPDVVPDYLQNKHYSAAWGDVATVAPWQLYQAYGDKQRLAEHLPMMRKWVDYVTSATTTPGLWTGGEHFGDWLALDSLPEGYYGATRPDYIASAYYAHSTALVVAAGRVLDQDVSEYEQLLATIQTTFKQHYPVPTTQTECVLALAFGLTDDVDGCAQTLAKMIADSGDALQTGFVGTPLLLPVLTAHGHNDLAYRLLLREAYPSWLYSVNHGATTVWEHWDSIKEDGSFWSTEMNSFNHYAYGSVMGWFYQDALGIRPDAPGYQQALFAPHPDPSLDWAEGRLAIADGELVSGWQREEDDWRFTIVTPVPAVFEYQGIRHQLTPGHYTFWAAVE